MKPLTNNDLETLLVGNMHSAPSRSEVVDLIEQCRRANRCLALIREKLGDSEDAEISAAVRAYYGED